jgi:Phosphoribulokinase / Uridine kinase family
MQAGSGGRLLQAALAARRGSMACGPALSSSSTCPAGPWLESSLCVNIGCRRLEVHRHLGLALALCTSHPQVVIIGVAADSGCGKSTFMRRLSNIFGGSTVGPLGGGFGNGGWETNTLVSDLTTVICLDDYHLNDRGGRKVSGRTALHTEEQRFDLMAEQLSALKVR